MPFLRLANGSGQQSYTGVVAPHTITQATGAIDSSARARLVKALIPLANIEDAVASVERTARKVLTHSQLGLGSGRTKPDLGRTKPDLVGAKPDLGGQNQILAGRNLIWVSCRRRCWKGSTTK